MNKQMLLHPKSVEGGAELTSGALLEKSPPPAAPAALRRAERLPSAALFNVQLQWHSVAINNNFLSVSKFGNITNLLLVFSLF